MKSRNVVCLLMIVFGLWTRTLLAEDTLAPLKDGRAPQSVEALWADFDPRAEPLGVESLKQWKEDDVVMQVLRYRVGVFKGQKGHDGSGLRLSMAATCVAMENWFWTRSPRSISVQPKAMTH